MRSRAAWLAGVLIACALLASCAQVPDRGPVIDAKEPGQAAPVQGQYNNPKGPQQGDSPSAVVTGFFVAMTATPIQTTTAQEFLTKQAQTQWRPQRGVVTYDDKTVSGRGQHVVVVLRGADHVGIRGQWQGPISAAARRLVLPMVREDDEWRIARVPDALFLPQNFFDQEFQSADIYFFDPTGRILVPEPVHLQQGTQFASALVTSLVRGPSPSLAGVSRTFLPSRLTPVVSVPVGDNGTADVKLKGPDPGPLSRTTTLLILNQLAYTLRQDPSITSFRLEIAGHQVTDATGAQTFRIDAETPHRLDPADSLASSQFYALRKGRLVSGQIERISSVGGPFGERPLGIRSFAVSLDGRMAAAVTDSELLVGSVSEQGEAVPVLTGTDLLRPSWDFAHRLWDVQDGPGGAVVMYVRHGRRHEVRVPGITHQNVRRFLVSRDGSRIVAVIRGIHSDRIVASRLVYDANGHATGATGTHRIRWLSSGTTRIRDIGWTSPTTIAVLDQLSPAQAEVRILNVDGSTPPDQAAPTTVPGRVRGLVTSPVDKPYAFQLDGLIDISPVDLNKEIRTGSLRHITYAG
jgi:hypothetical protein